MNILILYNLIIFALYSLNEHFEALKDSKTEVKVDNLEADQLDDIPTVVEEEGVSLFLEEAQQSKKRVTDLLTKYCMCVAKMNIILDGPKNLITRLKESGSSVMRLSNSCNSTIYLNVLSFQEVRNLFPVYNFYHLFQRDDEICNPSGFKIVIHAEILVSCRKTDLSLTIPSLKI